MQLTPGVVVAQISNPRAPRHSASPASGPTPITGPSMVSLPTSAPRPAPSFGNREPARRRPSAHWEKQQPGLRQRLTGVCIETSSFAPEFGNAPDGQVILTTRSGTNRLHGGLSTTSATPPWTPTIGLPTRPIRLARQNIPLLPGMHGLHGIARPAFQAPRSKT